MLVQRVGNEDVNSAWTSLREWNVALSDADIDAVIVYLVRMKKLKLAPAKASFQ